MNMVMPRLTKTGEFAQLEVSTRESRKSRSMVNVRFTLPRRSLFVAVEGQVERLPRSNSDSYGLPLSQFAVSMN